MLFPHGSHGDQYMERPFHFLCKSLFGFSSVWPPMSMPCRSRYCRRHVRVIPSVNVQPSGSPPLSYPGTQWDGPTLSVLREAGFDSSTLPPLSDIEGLRARVCGAALKRWPELHGASVRLGVGDGAAACLGSGYVNGGAGHLHLLAVRPLLPCLFYLWQVLSRDSSPRFVF